jgi:hypothetical protein
MTEPLVALLIERYVYPAEPEGDAVPIPKFAPSNVSADPVVRTLEPLR